MKIMCGANPHLYTLIILGGGIINNNLPQKGIYLQLVLEDFSKEGIKRKAEGLKEFHELLKEQYPSNYILYNVLCKQEYFVFKMVDCIKNKLGGRK